jgi:glycosyltransferase involved in cell wall biosynthesis
MIKNVLMIGNYVEPPWCDGVVNIIRFWSEGLFKLGMNVTILSSSSDSKEQLTLNGVKYEYFYGSQERFSWNFAQNVCFQHNLAKFLKKRLLEFHVCHVHGFDSLTFYPLFSWAKLLASTKFCLSFHSRMDVDRQSGLRKRIFDLFTAQNDNVKGVLLRAGILEEKIGVIPPCVDTDLFRPRKLTHCRSMLKLPQDSFVLVYAGHFKSGRGIEDLVSVHQKIQRLSSMRVILVLAWTGYAEKGYLPRIMETISKDSNIIVLGPQRNMSTVYNSADLVVSPIRGEKYVMSIPLNVLEAMACERLVLCTEIGATEFLEDGLNCLTIKPGDQGMMIRKILSVMNGELNTKEIGTLARETVVKRFSQDIVASQLKSLYEH